MYKGPMVRPRKGMIEGGGGGWVGKVVAGKWK